MIHSTTKYVFNINNFTNYQQSACSDQFVGRIELNNGKFEYVGKDVFVLTRKKNINGQTRQDVNYSSSTLSSTTNLKLAVLLESPHIDEFNIQGKTYTTAPAWGRTGDRFNTQFIKVLNKPSNLSKILSSLNISKKVRKNIDVYIVNAIQYQCSLGFSPINKVLRDFIFQNLWNAVPNSFLDDLVERLNFLSPDIIINACTISLQKLCCNYSNIAPKLNKKIPILHSNCHMSAWGKNTVIS